MELNLRKGHKLRKDIEAALSKFGTVTTVDLSCLSPEHVADPLKFVAAGGEAVLKSIEDYERLSGILTHVRSLIAHANRTAGIDDLLAKIADLDRRIRVWNGLIEKGKAADGPDVIKARIDRTKRAFDSDESRYAPSEIVTVSVLTDEIRERAANMVAKLRREREEAEDTRLAANYGATIKIANEDADFLREARLL